MCKRILIFFLFGGILASTSLAEVSIITDGTGNYRGILYLYETSAKETTSWQVFRPVADHLALNRDGNLHGDGIPDITLNPQTGLPEVVWSFHDGSDLEIAHAVFDGSQWINLGIIPQNPQVPVELPRQDINLITLNALDDFNPKLDIGTDGVRRLAWWKNFPATQVLYTERFPDAIVWPAARVLSQPGGESSYPDIGSRDGEIFVAIERIEAGMKLLVVIQGPSIDFTSFFEQRDTEPFGRFQITVSLSVESAGLNLQLNREQPFLEWRESPGLRGRSRYRPPDHVWDEPVLEEISTELP